MMQKRMKSSVKRKEKEMASENFVTFEIGKTKHIALVAHDGKKKELVE